MAKYDFMSFGEPNIRMTPPDHDRLGQSDELRLGIAAAELNCCVNISNLSVERLLPTMKTAYVTKLVDNWTGRYIVTRAMMYGVDMSNVAVEAFDKVGRTRNGLAFVELGVGPRPSYQIYDRGHSVLSKIRPGDIDWKRVLDTRWFHTTGIVTALGEHTAGEVYAALRAAKENGATTSYDINYRSTLWSLEDARAAILKLLPYVDVLFGGVEDFAAMFGIHPAAPAGGGLDGALKAYESAAAQVLARYPNLTATATSLRCVQSALLNDLQGCMMTREGLAASRLYRNVEINDRIGGGDSFASGLIWSLLNGHETQRSVDFAAAYSVLCHTIRNDWNLATREETEHLAAGGSARVQR